MKAQILFAHLHTSPRSGYTGNSRVNYVFDMRALIVANDIIVVLAVGMLLKASDTVVEHVELEKMALEWCSSATIILST